MEIRSSSAFVRMTRGALTASSFVRHERDGLVWFEHRRPESGPEAVVLIHGANDHAGTWFAVAPALALRHRVILPDLAGHGESEPQSGPIAISRVLAGLETLLQDERKLTLVGNSFGGWMALLFTLRNQERVSRLVLESSGGLNRPLAVPLVATNREEALTILRAVHGPKFVPEEWVIEALLARATDSPLLRLTEMDEHDVEPCLNEIRVPTSVLAGEHDGVVTRDYSEALRDAIPGATMSVIEEAGHIPHLQQPLRFLQCLTSIF